MYAFLSRVVRLELGENIVSLERGMQAINPAKTMKIRLMHSL